MVPEFAMKSPLNPLDADVPARSVRVHASLPGKERRNRFAPLVSFLVHAIVIYLAIRVTTAVTMPQHSPIGDAIQLVLGGGGGGGQGGSAFEHAVPPPPPPPVTPPLQPPPMPVPAVTPPPVVPPPPAAAPEPSSALPTTGAGTGAGTGGGNGPGSGTGTGSGQGPGTGSGSGGGNGTGKGISQPVWKQATLPPMDKTPKKLRGKQVDVTFTVSADGRALSWTVTPPIEDRGFAKIFEEVIRNYRFTPATDANGKPIPGTVTVSFTF
jgi:hypothetical protein